MKVNRKIAIIVGILFIIATAFLFIGESVYGPYLTSPNYLDLAYPNRISAVIGMLLEFLCVIAIALIPVCLFPVLRKFNESLALGYVVFRFMEAVLFVGEEIKKLSLIGLSQAYLNGGGMDASYFQNIGMVIQSEISWIFSFYLFFFTLGGLMFYWVLYKSSLIPRWLSGWGLLAVGFLLIGNVLNLLEVELGLSGVSFELIFAPPIAVQEMVMAAWLIVKGFNSSSLTSYSTRKN